MAVGALDTADTRLKVAVAMDGLRQIAGGVAAVPAVLDAGLAIFARASPQP